MTPEAAQREARLRFGNLTKAKETTRDLHSFTSIESLLQDLRYGLRRLRHESAFALTAILTLGLVIGANGTIFSILEALLFRPLPLNNPSRLVVLFGSSRQSSRQSIPILDFEEFQKAKSLSGLSASQTQSVNLTGVEEPGRLIGSFISSNCFSMLGIEPIKGRTFTA